jgi:ubiquitin-activating enzyme E1
MEDHA